MKKEVMLRFIKSLDSKNRILIPNYITKIQKSKEFYVELHKNGNIVLIPTEKGGK